MKDQEELEILELWFGNTLLQAFKVLPKAFRDPNNAKREMNRLNRHSKYQLQRTINLATGANA